MLFCAQNHFGTMGYGHYTACAKASGPLAAASATPTTTPAESKTPSSTSADTPRLRDKGDEPLTDAWYNYDDQKVRKVRCLLFCSVCLSRCGFEIHLRLLCRFTIGVAWRRLQPTCCSTAAASPRNTNDCTTRMTAGAALLLILNCQ